jgi:exopolyphosphatase/guanosine-5'-triphosphate,3'-diphosphate pyrophosphatase
VAALLHDVGRSKHDKSRHKMSYRLIRKLTPPLGWSASDLQLVAVVARFHRGAIPSSRSKPVQVLALDQKKIATHLAGILRFTNALDGESEGRIERVRLEKKDDVLVIEASGYAPWTRRAEDIAGASYLLQLVLRTPILVKPLKRMSARRLGSKRAS